MQLIYLLIFALFFIAFIIALLTIIFIYSYELLLAKVSQEISDGYVIFTVNGKVTDYNNAFLKLFNFTKKEIKRNNVYDIFSEKHFTKEDANKINKAFQKVMKYSKRIKFDVATKNNIKKLHIEIMSVINNNIFVRYVIIIKDVTKTYQIIEELKANQDLMANRERFATLGQLVSGIVHSLKSPIFSITGELEQVENLIDEYSNSVGDETVTIEDHYEIANDMEEWLGKIRFEIENISDSITTIKNQIVTLNNNDDNSIFTVDEVVKYIDILMKNTLKQYLIILNFIVKVRKDLEIHGNINGLVHVINNLIMNSIDSYEGIPNQTIDIIIEENNKNLEISVIDNGKGIPKNIQNKIFKEIIPTNSNSKTGLGLFISYSNIKAHFGGDIEFTSKVNEGSTFKIIIPIK